MKEAALIKKIPKQPKQKNTILKNKNKISLIEGKKIKQVKPSK